MKNVFKFIISYLVSIVLLLAILLILGLVLQNVNLKGVFAKVLMLAVKGIALTVGLALLSNTEKFILKSLLFGALFSLFIIILSFCVSGGAVFSALLILDIVTTLIMSVATAVCIRVLARDRKA